MEKEKTEMICFVPKGELLLGNSCPSLEMRVYSHEFPVENKSKITIMAGGFAKVATNELMFKQIVKRLDHPAIIFNWRGLGVSDGSFFDITVDKMNQDIRHVINWVRLCGYENINLILHNIACCLAPIDNSFSSPFNKYVFLAPALNQAFLLRYWWACANEYSVPLDKNDFNNWQHEADYMDYIKNNGGIINGQVVSSQYWLTESSRNYDLPGPWSEDCVFVFGSKDRTVPYDSGEFRSDNEHKIIEGADHCFTGKEEELASFVTEFIGCNT